MPKTIRFDKKHSKKLYQPWTDCEKLLFDALLNAGVKFICNCPVEGKIVDFYFSHHKVVVEIDGSYHRQPQKKLVDEQKQQLLESRGYVVLRFTNKAVRESVVGVVSAIKRHLSD